MIMRKISIFLFFILAIIGCSIEPIDIIESGQFLYKSNDSTILKVTPRIWNHGCTNTSVGMLIEYYKDLGYKDLMDDMNDIVSEQHINYYAYPIDKDNLQQDSSILKSPPQNCLADFMKTSWYSEGCYYAGTEFYNILPGIEKYVKSKHPWYNVEYEDTYYFEHYCKAIDEGRPVLIAVLWGKGSHMVLGIGYNKSDTSFYCYDTWFTEPRKVQWTSFDPRKEDWIIRGIMDLKITL